MSNAPEPPLIKSLLIVRLSAIGDTCNVVPVVRTLQRAYPKTQLTWLMGQTEAQLLGDLDGITIIPIDKRHPGKTLKQLRRQRFDVLLHMHASLRANWMVARLKAKRKIGFDPSRAREGMRWVVHETIDTPPRTHVLDGFFGFAEKLGITERDLRWDIPIPDVDRDFATRCRRDAKPLVVINPSSSIRRRNYRNWAPERYSALADFAQAQCQAQVILTGGPSDIERDLAHQINVECRHKPLNLVGETSLKRLLAILSAADVVVAPDTGPAHMATAVGTPVIGLFASSNPRRTGPFLSLDTCINAYPQALNQHLNMSVEEASWGQRVREPNVMQLIQTETVCQQLQSVLASR